MLPGYPRQNYRVSDSLLPQSKRFHAWDLRLLKRHPCGGTPTSIITFHTTRIYDAASNLSRREYFSWIQTEYPREIPKGNRFIRLQPVVPDPSLSSQDADLQMLEKLLDRYNPSTMLKLELGTLEVAGAILRTLRRIQTDIYIPEIRTTLQTYSIRTSIKWLYTSLNRYKGQGRFSYPRPLELGVGDKYALVEAIKYYNPERFGVYNEGAIAIVKIIRAYLRWHLWKLQVKLRIEPRSFLGIRQRRRDAWKPHLPVIRE